MTETTVAKREEQSTKSRAKPLHERLGQKQPVSARCGATTNELAEEQAKEGDIWRQRAAVRPASGDVVSPTPISPGPPFAHDFSGVPAHTVAPQTRPAVQARPTTAEPLTLNLPDDQYGQEADHMAEAVMPMLEPGIQLTPT